MTKLVTTENTLLSNNRLLPELPTGYALHCLEECWGIEQYNCEIVNKDNYDFIYQGQGKTPREAIYSAIDKIDAETRTIKDMDEILHGY